MASTVLRQIGVGHHNEVILGAAKRLHALAMRGGFFVDDLRHRRRSDERDGLDERMGQQRFDDFAPAMDELYHACGKAGFVQ